MIEATISADVINSTSFDKDDMFRLNQHLKSFIEILERTYHGCWGRVVRGDGVEVVVPRIKDVMRIAIMLKCHVKAMNVNFGVLHALGNRRRIPHFGVRVVIGIGDLRINDREKDIIDGDAIYNSGRMLSRLASKSRGTLILVGGDPKTQETAQALLSLIDVIVMHSTAKQCDIMVKRFLGMSEDEIANQVGITRSAVNTHLRRAGWFAISSTIDFFENVLCR